MSESLNPLDKIVLEITESIAKKTSVTLTLDLHQVGTIQTALLGFQHTEGVSTQQAKDMQDTFLAIQEQV